MRAVLIFSILFPFAVTAKELCPEVCTMPVEAEVPYIQYELPNLEGYESRPWSIKSVGWVIDLTQPEEPEVCVVEAEVMRADDPLYLQLKDEYKTPTLYEINGVLIEELRFEEIVKANDCRFDLLAF